MAKKNLSMIKNKQKIRKLMVCEEPLFFFWKLFSQWQVVNKSAGLSPACKDIPHIDKYHSSIIIPL